MADEQKLHFNGVNGDTGEYDLPPMSVQDLVRVVRGEAMPENLGELRRRVDEKKSVVLGVKEGVDPKDLKQAGWGVIFAHDADPGIEDALSELIAWRREQAGDRFRVYRGTDGYRVGKDTKTSFLTRNNASFGPVDPEKVPYYVLLAGGPDKIPFRFQTQLDVQFAVGRIHFDTLDDYAAYAHSVVTAEKGGVRLPRQAAFFGTANSGDAFTAQSLAGLVEPLLSKLTVEHPDWQMRPVLRERATKAALTGLLGGAQTPALLFTASHGMCFDLGKPRQLAHQGALLCQDWPGPAGTAIKDSPIPQDWYFAGDDLAPGANLLGMIAFFFACYGLGTPELSEYGRLDAGPGSSTSLRTQIAPHPFLAQLPAKMLSHPGGGALAVIGHIERAWSYSFAWDKAGAQTAVFESTLKRLFEGHPIGSAVEFFNERYAECSTVLNDELEEVDFGRTYDPYELAGLWTANNDARGYAVFGDPAVRLPVVTGSEAPVERPVIVVPAASQSTASMAPVGKALTVRTYISRADAGAAPGSLTVTTVVAADGSAQTDVAPGAGIDAAAVRMLHEQLAQQFKAAP